MPSLHVHSTETMKRIVLLAAALVAGAASATTLIALDVTGLTETSDLVVRGSVVSVAAHWSGDNARIFFAEFEQKGSQYAQTRSEVLRRLLQVLDSPTFARMLDTKTMRLNIAEALDSGKVILVNTDARLLKGPAHPLRPAHLRPG